METLSIALAGSLGLACALFVAWPLLRGAVRRSSSDERATEVAELKDEKDKLLQALKEIEFDHRTGKLSDEDFQSLRADYRRRAIEALERLEKAAPSEGSVAAIEADVLRALGRQKSGGPQRCAGCGERVGSEARFCPNCGVELARLAS